MAGSRGILFTIQASWMGPLRHFCGIFLAHHLVHHPHKANGVQKAQHQKAQARQNWAISSLALFDVALFEAPGGIVTLVKMASVEGWSELALTTFLYLEHYRVAQLARRGLTEKEKDWWRHQRTHGLCQAVRLASEESEIKYIADRLETPGGIAKLKRLIRDSFAPEYRAAI